MYYAGSFVVIVVFDKSSMESFISSELYIEEAKYLADERSTFIVLGNKSDLESVVSFEQGHEFALRYGALYAEVSAKTGENIENCFLLITEELLKILFLFEIMKILINSFLIIISAIFNLCLATKLNEV